MTVTEEEPSPAEPDGTPPATPARAPVAPLPLRVMLQRSAAVLVAVAAVLLAGLGARAWVLAHSPDRAAAVLDAARACTVEVLSYDAATLDADLAAARAQVTGAFARQFEQVAASLILPASRERSVVTRAEVVRAAVVEAQTRRVEVLLFVNQTTTSVEQPQPQVTASEIAVTMAFVDGRWLISELRPL